MSLGGAAVGFAGAKADSTGVTGREVFVGDGSCLGAEAMVGAGPGVAEQEFRIRIKGRRAKQIFFIRAPQGECRLSAVHYNTGVLKCPHSLALNQISRNLLRDEGVSCRAGMDRCDDLNRLGADLDSDRQLTDQVAVTLYG